MFLIRVSTGSNFGKGHINRCLKIREKIKNRVIWFVDKGAKQNSFVKFDDKIVEEVSSSSISKTTNYALDNNIKAIIIDNPNVKNLKKMLFFGVKPIIILVDKHIIYKNVLSICMHPINIKEKNFISGYEYLPLVKKQKKICKNPNKKNILVSFGNIDSKCLTEKVISTFQKLIESKDLNLNQYIINIILGRFKKNIKLIKSITASNKKFKLIHKPNSLDSLYKKCDFAIGAPGFSQVERLEYKIPSILIAQNEIQKKILESWEKSGCALVVKNIKTDLKNNIFLMIQNEKVKNDIQKKIAEKFDGNGTERILKKIDSYVKNFKSN